MKFRSIFIPCLTVVIAVVLMLSSCHTLKTVSHKITDSVKVDTSTITKVAKSDFRKDSTQTHVKRSFFRNRRETIKDTAIGLKGQKIGFTVAKGVRVDTVIEDGILNLHVYTDADGNTRAVAELDSATIIVQKLRRVNDYVRNSNDSISVRYSELQHKYDSVTAIKKTVEVSHVDVKVQERQLSWWGKITHNIGSVLSFLVGVICILAILWIKKRFF